MAGSVKYSLAIAVQRLVVAANEHLRRLARSHPLFNQGLQDLANTLPRANTELGAFTRSA